MILLENIPQIILLSRQPIEAIPEIILDENIVKSSMDILVSRQPVEAIPEIILDENIGKIFHGHVGK